MPESVKILIADDESTIRDLVRRILEDRGYVVLQAADGEEALSLAASGEPDLILLDANMPKLSGFEVCERLRSEPGTQDIPVVMLTGEAATIDKAIEGLRAGADEYLYKPFRKDALLDIIQSNLPDVALSRSAKILIVDDSQVNLQVMQGYLHQTGYRLDMVTNGEDALVMAHEHPPDIVLLDVQMPGMDGYEVCRRLKQDSRTSSIPVMFVTANALGDDEMLRGYEFGAVDYLRKPFLREELLARLHVMVRLRQQQAELERQAFLDPLTNLANRRHLANRLSEEFSRAKRHGMALTTLLLDLDHFKNVNDTHGHDAGDEVLRRVGALLADTVRNEDVVGRYGGEEFAFLLPQTPLDPAIQIAERICGAVAGLVTDYEGTPIQVTASIGVANYPMLTVEQPRELLRYADEALYKAKSSGRNQVRVLRPAEVGS